MSYENATPKALKFLISNGDLVDDSGNVIAHSDSLKDMYDKATPQVKKFLLSDGSVVDESGNLIIKNDYFKKVYDQATPKVAKYLHADGTVDENSGEGGGGSEITNGDIELPIWETPYRQNMFIIFDENNNIVSEEKNLSKGKWFFDFQKDQNQLKNIYTESDDDYPYNTNIGNDVKNCSISIVEVPDNSYYLTIKNENDETIVDNSSLILKPRKIGSVIGLDF